MTSDWGVRAHHTVRGVRYAVRTAGSGRPLLLLHGFAGSSVLWAPLVPALVVRGWQIIAPDLLGHGESDTPDDPARYAAHDQVADLLALMETRGLAQCALLGYSMGGRLALQFALAHPERISALVLESTTPGIADPAERAARQQADEELACAIAQYGVAWFADHWEQLPLFASRQNLPPALRALLRQQWLAQRAQGLAASLRGFGTGTMPAVWDRLPELRPPTLVIVGALDPKYVAIGRAMAARIPQSRFVVVPQAGHTVHLEQPEAWLSAVDTLRAH